MILWYLGEILAAISHLCDSEQLKVGNWNEPVFDPMALS
jgi:hypothetical protein